MTENKNDAVDPSGKTRISNTNQPPVLPDVTSDKKNAETEQTVEQETTDEIIGFTQSEWDTKKAKLQQQFPQLTEEDLKFEEGKHAELYERVQTRLDKTNFEIKSIIENLK